MQSFLSNVGKLIYKINRWSYDDVPEFWPDKQVAIGFPHTSNMDTVMAFTYSRIINADAKILIKAEWFFWPMSSILNTLGGVPVIRDKSSGFVTDIIKEFQRRKKFLLAIVPEGTRKKTVRIKTGFWNIAKGAGVPINCWYLDNKNKQTKWIGHIIPSNDLVEDLLKIKAMYLKHGYLIPLGDMDQYKQF